MPERVSALIVGAGGAGLSLSLLLLQQGIQPLLIERRPDISVYPRARNLNFRTLEVFRGLGLEAAIRAAGAGWRRGPHRAEAELDIPVNASVLARRPRLGLGRDR